MLNLDRLDVVLLAALFGAETLVVGIAIWICQAPARSRRKDTASEFSAGEVRRVDYFSRFGPVVGWLLCFLLVAGVGALAFAPYGKLLAVVCWWVVALNLFGLTVRQTLKLNISLGLLHVAFVVGIGVGL